MKKLLFFLSLCFFACGNDAGKNQNVVVETQAKIISKTDIEKLNFVEFILDRKAEVKIQDWESYFELDSHITNLKQADLSFFKNNNENLAAFINDLNGSIPEHVNSSSILARMTALETKIFKLEGIVNLSKVEKNELTYAIKEVLMSFSNLNFQINKKFEKESYRIQKPN